MSVSEPRWHDDFDPQRFLSRVDVDALIERNKARNENVVDAGSRHCMLCGGAESPGLLLNEGSYVCRSCFDEVSRTKYPQKYESKRREFIAAREARRQAKRAFEAKCFYRRLIPWLVGVGVVCLLLTAAVQVLFVVVAGVAFALCAALKHLHRSKMQEWTQRYPEPLEPELLHFHDPHAMLTSRDRLLLKVFNNWPGYPPFWEYLRAVVLQRDGNRCQVSGCPSRLPLHVHHMVSVSAGGEHIPSNLVSLCAFHHGLEPEQGHERVWGQVKSRYFTMVRSHRRRNPRSPGYHTVRAYVRRLEVIDDEGVREIIAAYGLLCPQCGSREIALTHQDRYSSVGLRCGRCGRRWEGPRKLAEETGPRLAELLTVTRNKGRWRARWDMLEPSAFRELQRRSEVE